MARLLLCLVTAGRVVVLLAAVTTVPACIIPLAPDFQDPPSEENDPPQILDANPDRGSVGGSKIFMLLVKDPTPGDSLYVRWIADFPPFSEQNTRLLDSQQFEGNHDGTPLTKQIGVEVNCDLMNLSRQIQRHQILAALADDQFDDQPGNRDLTKVKNGRLATIATWILELQCPITP